MINVQFELFESNDEISLLRREIEGLRKSQHSVRKSLFAQNNSLGKLCLSLKEELYDLRILMIERKK